MQRLRGGRFCFHPQLAKRCGVGQSFPRLDHISVSISRGAESEGWVVVGRQMGISSVSAREMSSATLLTKAWEARERAYAPYSGFAVGAALETEDGNTFVGCNVENLSFGLTICAERVAVGAAIAAGVRRFSKLAIVSDSKQPVSPCGACRQVLAEFAPDLAIICENREGEQFIASLSELLPRAKTGILDSGVSPLCST